MKLILVIFDSVKTILHTYVFNFINVITPILLKKGRICRSEKIENVVFWGNDEFIQLAKKSQKILFKIDEKMCHDFFNSKITIIEYFKNPGVPEYNGNHRDVVRGKYGVSERDILIGKEEALIGFMIYAYFFNKDFGGSLFSTIRHMYRTERVRGKYSAPSITKAREWLRLNGFPKEIIHMPWAPYLSGTKK